MLGSEEGFFNADLRGFTLITWIGTWLRGA